MLYSGTRTVDVRVATYVGSVRSIGGIRNAPYLWKVTCYIASIAYTTDAACNTHTSCRVKTKAVALETNVAPHSQAV